TDIEGVLPTLDSEERDLGVLHPIPNGPLLHYRVHYHEPGETELLDLYVFFACRQAQRKSLAKRNADYWGAAPNPAKPF
ncbi:MAG: hypothetical protein IKM08_01935, partial [Clostridia bacterium]|nr:hypothetical protein [Clostridia bacterium]